MVTMVSAGETRAGPQAGKSIEVTPPVRAVRFTPMGEALADSRPVEPRSNILRREKNQSIGKPWA